MARLDLEHLARQTMNDANLQREVLRIFEQQMNDKMADLACAQGSVKELAHSIKGSARGVGAVDVAALAEKLEQADCPDPTLIAQLGNAVEEAMEDIRAILNL